MVSFMVIRNTGVEIQEKEPIIKKCWRFKKIFFWQYNICFLESNTAIENKSQFYFPSKGYFKTCVTTESDLHLTNKKQSKMV